MLTRLSFAAVLLVAASAAAAQQTCAGARERAGELRVELEKSVPAPARAAAEKSPGEHAAAALLAGDTALAAWAGLKAAEAAWNGKRVADAGTYLHYAGRGADALRMLNCAYALGYRSPYLFEALATAHKTQGRDGEARQAIAEAQRLAPDDPLIEAAASVIETGKPPPAPKPEANDNAARCIAALERHSRRVLAVRKQNHVLYDRLETLALRVQVYAAEPKSHQDLIDSARGIARNARRTPGDAMQENLAITPCLGAYFQLTGSLLDSYYYLAQSPFELVFWANALRLDPQAYVRDLPCGTPGTVCGMRSASSLNLRSLAVESKRYFGEREATQQYNRDSAACPSSDGASSSCNLRARARECATNKALIEEWSAMTQQRVNTARLNFDNESRYVVSLAESEIGAAREFAVSILRGLRKGGQAFPGLDGKPGTSADFVVGMANRGYTDLYREHLLDGGKLDEFLKRQADWFGEHRSLIEEDIASMKRSHDQRCEPVMLELRMEQLQEQYQAYLEHLRDRMRWGVDSRVDTKLPCDFSVAGFSGQADLNDLGEGKFGYKMTKGPISGSGSVTVGADGVKFSGSAGTKVRGVGVGVDSGGSSSVGRSGKYGPFAGKADATFTTAVNPWNNREYLGIRIRGSAGFGVGTKGGGASASCYPSSGQVTIYPRALLEDVGRYFSAK